MDVCAICNSRVAPGSVKCPNCNSNMVNNLGIQYKKKDQRGVSQQPGTQDMYTVAQDLALPPQIGPPMMPGAEDPLAVELEDEGEEKSKIEKKKKKERIHRSDEIKMMSDPDEDNSDTNMDEIQQSMDDLSYDG